MSTPYLGEIRAVGFTFAPVDWVTCNGQLLAISENDALYSLLGTTYGGDGINTFAVPSLNGRVAVGAQGGATGPGLSNYPLGQQGGTETVTLLSTQIPPHTHAYTAALGGSTTGNLNDDPAGRRPGAPASATYAGAPESGKNLAAGALSSSVTPAGGSQPHPNIQPVLALNYIICTAGIYPSQP
jgi:microcystin-dependent protein